MGSRKLLQLAAALVAVILTLSLGASAAAQDVAAQVRAKLDKSQYKNVEVNVDANGVATLTGTVNLYEYKADADKTVHKVKGVTAVRNSIEVAGPSVPDSQLQKSLGEKLAYDRVGYGNVFDAITLQVENGVVTLGGSALDYPSRDSALGVVSTTPGVKEVVDEISVDPVSPMDWQTRVAVARAVYGFPSLNKYAIDPAKPIRIAVQNGNVALYGVVDSEADKDAAGIRANGVPGVFSVKNYLQVANQPSESKK
ncbi:MAG: BON domain-containing protein [Terracidiphilus sp.]|jgi:osmotically-inducible protein OsmY